MRAILLSHTTDWGVSTQLVEWKSSRVDGNPLVLLFLSHVLMRIMEAVSQSATNIEQLVTDILSRLSPSDVIRSTVTSYISTVSNIFAC